MSNQTSMSVDDIPVPRIVDLVDKFILGIGKGVSWLSILLITTILLQVILRYVFSSGLVALEELQWHIYAVLVMNAVAYGVTEDIHIRMDLFYHKHSGKTKAWIDIFGLALFAIPLSLVLCIKGIDLALASFAVSEISNAPEGLPLRWLVKSVLPFSMALYAIAAISRIIRSLDIIFRRAEK